MASSEYILEYLVVIALGLFTLPLLYRLGRGPTTSDRLLTLELIGALGVLILVGLSVIAGRTIYLDLAILLTLFSFLGTLIVARYLERGLL
ncbi:MAG: monovalent cation/H+ antiporter complex subunit F [Chloroflexi bacterium]|nr:monovalent cation/H+ antiporter complex subunit F [Chloroflexota bacterium]MCI0575948.1 monovalent cation/H+ antiporter complex subunit F [Chloroflexota bacterium]MCI0643729.1 monovalent cation/H+ antiporter complex subunit F [Chloroflexota bacterium]MCI0725894.1 monovalent cation/H+ antiporter complex subunit F [Chloroflexota bacterium]